MLFNLKKKIDIPNNESDFLKDYHDLWRKDLKERNENFFMLYKDFSNFLPELSTGALKLYLFYGFNAKNETGESWYSIDTISEKLATTPRSINTWNSELEKLGLIYRSSENKSSKTTFLIPYTDQIIFSDLSVSNFMTDYLKNENIKKFMGEINQIYHFFQWRKNLDSSDTDKYNKPLNLLSIELSKEYDFNSSEKYVKKTYMIFNLENYNQFEGSIEEKYMSESTPIFIFDNVYNNDLLDNFSIKGIVVNTKFDLFDKKKLFSILNELDETTDFTYYPKAIMNSKNIISTE
ncbi:hypothetical protein [Tissierella pigra]|uniref:Helix-turn-helix domain-containing protein n=1 Tax=Tissierella pigra TaxID=2607614 RepID=A0A6N7XKP4_9FIRM|nr:hypothetical protein [Tissierella pigra]MSU02146.1 hypothetical protein [Tissierella pigra]